MPFASSPALRAARLSAAAGMLALGVVPPLPAQTLPTAQPAPTEAQQVEKLLRDRQPELAIARADALLAKNPRNVQVRFLRAVALGDLGKSSEAGAAFETMTQEFPELPEPYNNLAVLQAAAGRYEQARTLLLRAIEVAPGYVTARENLGDLHVAIAADAYARALALDPDNAALKAKLAAAREAGSRLRAAR
jgi:Flp pilus assembly protein TadD